MVDRTAIPASDYRAIVDEVQRGIDVCAQFADLRPALSVLLRRTQDETAKKTLEAAVKSCEGIARLRVDFTALSRRLRELDDDLTPVRPPSRTDIKAAFDASVEFAQGKKKPTKDL